MTVTEEKKEKWIKKSKKILGMPIPFIHEKVSAEKLSEDAPLLFLIQENKKIKVLKNIKAGKLVFDTDDGKEKESATKSILIDHSKKCELEYEGATVPIYIAYVNEATCYPHDVKKDSSTLYLFFQKIILEFSLMRAGDNDGKIMTWIKKNLILIFFIIGALYYAYQTGLMDKIAGWISSGTQQLVTNTTNTNAIPPPLTGTEVSTTPVLLNP